MIQFIFVFFLLLYIFHVSTKKYLNPYKLTMVFGKKGSGKSTFLVKTAVEHLLLGWNVYSNVDMPFCYKISDEDIGFKHIPENSVLLLDEVGMIWDNRHFKTFKTEVRDWFKLQRHYKVKVFLFSQTFDIDKKLRDLTDEMYLVERRLRVFSYGKRILKRITLVEAGMQGESRIDENLKFDSLLFFWCGSRKFTYIPKYIKYFDSFDAPTLEGKEYEYLDTYEFNKLKKKINRSQKKYKKRKY